MGRIGELDLRERLAPAVPRFVTSIAVGLLATISAGVLRFILDTMLPGAAVFVLIYPAAMVATLFAGWLSGAAAGTLSILLAWYYLFPIQRSFALQSQAQAATLISVAIAVLATVLLAELFHRAVRRAAAERDREIADRDLFLDEFDHRVKNNFALVASLLDMQRRRAGDTETAQALSEALNRVESIARAHRHLYRGGATPGSVDIGTYLHELCGALAEALFLRGAITLDCAAEHAAIARDRAVSIGLIVNELVTNAAKHAFTERDTGHIEVKFQAAESGWQLTVRDNGVGVPAAPAPTRYEGGLGQRLIQGFVRQAHGTISTESGADGTTVVVTLTP